MSNVQAFVDASNDWGNDRVREYGATDINMMQVVLGGEAAGTVQIGF